MPRERLDDEEDVDDAREEGAEVPIFRRTRRQIRERGEAFDLVALPEGEEGGGPAVREPLLRDRADDENEYRLFLEGVFGGGGDEGAEAPPPRAAAAPSGATRSEMDAGAGLAPLPKSRKSRPELRQKPRGDILPAQHRDALESDSDDDPDFDPAELLLASREGSPDEGAGAGTDARTGREQTTPGASIWGGAEAPPALDLHGPEGYNYFRLAALVRGDHPPRHADADAAMPPPAPFPSPFGRGGAGPPEAEADWFALDDDEEYVPSESEGEDEDDAAFLRLLAQLPRLDEIVPRPLGPILTRGSRRFVQRAAQVAGEEELVGVAAGAADVERAAQEDVDPAGMSAQQLQQLFRQVNQTCQLALQLYAHVARDPARQPLAQQIYQGSLTALVNARGEAVARAEAAGAPSFSPEMLGAVYQNLEDDGGGDQQQQAEDPPAEGGGAAFPDVALEQDPDPLLRFPPFSSRPPLLTRRPRSVLDVNTLRDLPLFLLREFVRVPFQDAAHEGGRKKRKLGRPRKFGAMGLAKDIRRQLTKLENARGKRKRRKGLAVIFDEPEDREDDEGDAEEEEDGGNEVGDGPGAAEDDFVPPPLPFPLELLIPSEEDRRVPGWYEAAASRRAVIARFGVFFDPALEPTRARRYSGQCVRMQFLFFIFRCRDRSFHRSHWRP